MSVFPMVQGFGLTASLIVAIGAQNAFVLKQGIKRQHRLLTASLCILFDILLITAGVMGLSLLIEQNPEFLVWFRVIGSSFLFMYGLKSLMSAARAKGYEVSLEKPPAKPWTTVLTLLAFTFLNPHTYLDTVVLIGGTGAQFDPNEKALFIIGAILASIVWFFSLTYGASKLAPLFQKTKTWQILDTLMGIMMFILGALLIYPMF